MKAKKIFGTLTAKFAALALAFGCVSGAWGADPVTIQNEQGANIGVYEVSSGLYQSGTTYGNSTDFYITNLNGLKFFRDIVNGETAASYAYFTATGVTGTYPTTPAGIKSFHSNNMFSGKTVHLCEDIDLAGEQWVSIGFNRAERTITDPDTSASASVSKCTFYGLFDAGIYDGEGNLTGTHVISNLDTSWQYVPEAATLQEKYQLTGLFGQLSGGTTAGVKNLTVSNATVVGRTDVGVIAGRSYNGGAKIENCHVVGTVNVSGTGTYIGGLVGECRASIVNSSLDAAAGSSISGLAYVGGLAGSVFQYNANDSVEVSGSAVSNTTVSASYSGVAGVGALVGVTNPSGTYHGNVVISGNEANNVPVSAPNSSASKGGVGTLVGNALYDDGAYAIVADNTVSGTTSATAGGDTVTSKMGAANDNIAVGANVTFDESGKVTGGIFEVINEEVIATGYITDNNPDTETSTSYPLIIGGPYVALIGTTPYSTLADAVAAANATAGSDLVTIMILQASVTSGAATITHNLLIDTELAGGATIDFGYNDLTVQGGATVTFADDVAALGGVILNVVGGSPVVPDARLILSNNVQALYVMANVSGGEIKIEPSARVSVNNDYPIYLATGKVTVNGNLESGAGLTATSADVAGSQQLNGGYYCLYYGNNALEFENTFVTTLYVEPTSYWIPAYGSTLAVNMNNATWYLWNYLGENAGKGLNMGGLGTLTMVGSRLIANGTVLLNSGDVVNMSSNSTITAGAFSNNGVINIDATGITVPFKAIDYTGSGAMTLADYGTVNVIDGMVYVDDNDLWVKKLPVAQVISANGATTNKYDTLLAALEAATNGTTVELLSDVDEDIGQIPALQNATLDFCGHTLTGQLKGYYSKKIDGFVVKNGTIVGRDSNNWANLQIASGSKNVVVENMTLTTVRNNGSRSGYAFYNQSGSSVALRNVLADGRFYVGNSGSIIAIESGTYRNTFNGAHAIQNNGVVAAKGGTFYYNPTTPNNLVADGYVATETTDGENVQCWVIERGPSLATIKLADGTETEYWDINEAFGAIEEGCTLTIKPGVYTLAAGTGAAGAYNLPANVTIVGAGDSVNDVRISSLNQSNPKGLILSGSGITVSNIYFKAEQNEGSALVIRGSGTVVDCVLDGMNETYHCVSDGMYQGVVNGTLHFLRCSILAERYAINVGETSGEVIIEDCTVKGWSSFGSGIKVTVLNTTFAEGTVTDPDYSSPYNDIRFYDDAFISNCTFNAQMEVNICYESKTGIKLIVDDSTYQGEGKLSSIITESATQSSAGSSDIANNHVAVGTGVRLNEDGEIIGGLFETLDDELIAEQYGTGANSDSETSATYPTAVGLIEVLELEEQPGATATEATYKVSVVVVDADGHAIGTVSTEQTMLVRIGDADVANATLAKFDVDKIIAAAFATAGDDSTSITTIELLVKKTAGEAGAESVTYEVHPEAIVTIEKSGEAATAKTIALSDAALATNASFSFDLDVSALSVAVGDWVKVTHVSVNHAAEESLYKAKASGSGKVVTVTTTHFSTFTATPGDPAGADASLLPSVTNKVVSANLFGALTVNAGTATNAFIAVPFGAFGIGDAAITAADVVQAAALSAGDKMYVWNGTSGTSQKYEVYKVDANGTWVVEEHKVTVDANGTVTEGSESPESLGLQTGTGLFIERKDTSKPIYVYGQVLTNTVAETTFGSGLTLVSAPSTNAMAQINLNALTWSGVKDVTVTTTTSGKKIVTSYTNADFIYYRNAENKVIRLYHYGEKWGTVSGTWKDATDAAIIPAGTAFWYMNHGSARVTW